MNLMDYRQTGLHTAFEVVRDEATQLGLGVTGSEVIGMLPKQALLDAGMFYLQKTGSPKIPSEQHIIDAAISSLGLRDKTRFRAKEKIIEYALEERRMGGKA